MSLLTKLGHIGLGALPEQKFFGKRIGWYNPAYGVMSESILEGAACLIVGAALPDLAIYPVLLATSDAMRMGEITGGNINPYGNIVLEGVWNTGKGLFYTGPKALKRRLSKSNRNERDSVYPGGEGY